MMTRRNVLRNTLGWGILLGSPAAWAGSRLFAGVADPTVCLLPWEEKCLRHGAAQIAESIRSVPGVNQPMPELLKVRRLIHRDEKKLVFVNGFRQRVEFLYDADSNGQIRFLA